MVVGFKLDDTQVLNICSVLISQFFWYCQVLKKKNKISEDFQPLFSEPKNYLFVVCSEK